MNQVQQVEQAAAICKALRVPFNPELPHNFDNTPNEARPTAHRRWWFRPFIVAETWDEIEACARSRADEYAAGQIAKLPQDRESWFSAWPDGVRYEVRCLDGGAWDRSTSWGMFGTLEEALQSVWLGLASRPCSLEAHHA